jgi:PAS domain S-box-containing protein
MTEESPGGVVADECPSAPLPSGSSYGSGSTLINRTIELSPQLRADLLNTEAWSEILVTYGQTMKVAVALTDDQGHMLGECHNPQPVWKLIHDHVPATSAACPFCVGRPCSAVAEALQTGHAVMVHDQVGLTHVAVPLSLGTQHLGAIVAGQVFDRYPESIPLQRVAKDFALPVQPLWDVARKQAPVSRTLLQASGQLLRVLGHAFLQQRYAAILETRLAENNERFRFLVEGVKDHALFTVGLTGQVTGWNRGADRLLGFVEAEIVGRHFSCIFDAEDIGNHLPEKQLHQALQTGWAEAEGWHVRGNGQRFWASVSVTAMEPQAGPVHGFAILVQDLTERGKIATALEETRQERAHLQEQLISHVSHELRTPLTAIYFFLTNLLDGLLGELNFDQREHITLALDNVKQLKEMVNDLLDITRVETHKLVVEPQHANPSRIISGVLSTCLINAAARSINLRFAGESSLPSVWADPPRVRQILTNLIDNGIKFTPEGGTVTVYAQLFTENKSFLRFSVADTGCGISPQNCSLVFDRLAQVKTSSEASRSGLGLGLFIARELVLLHGGRIWVESRQGKGSTFYFTLPVFSLAKLCAHLFTRSNLELGYVSLITVDMIAVEGAAQAELLPEIRKVLRSCIHGMKDLLLPSMSDAETMVNFFIVACTNAGGAAAIANRVTRELQNFDSASKLKPVLAHTTLAVAPGVSRDEQIGEVSAQIERLIQAHLSGEERLDECPG